ncbi:hypothetical protein MUK42_37340 [Musa troglodytarum]|uniref:Uncharacterized protein n=1 Tax=Musa troglodytarum TaxID=320322 RepID=A0A9E7G747_9LILI|nr:hypothetical protein MUK42_37340 [Musa troglodytarum]
MAEQVRDLVRVGIDSGRALILDSKFLGKLSKVSALWQHMPQCQHEPKRHCPQKLPPLCKEAPKASKLEQLFCVFCLCPLEEVEEIEILCCNPGTRSGIQMLRKGTMWALASAGR